MWIKKETYRDHAILLRRGNGAFGQIVVNEASRRFAIGKAPGVEPGRVVYCKTADQISLDERDQWDMLTGADKRADFWRLREVSLPH